MSDRIALTEAASRQVGALARAAAFIGKDWPAISSIQEATVRHFGIPAIEMVSQRRARRVARPRQVAMYLAHELTPHSSSTIGWHFGHRDHTTVLHAIARIEALAKADPDFGKQVASLRAQLSVAA